MANHCFYHFSEKLSLNDVENAVRFFCKERLGDESLVVRNDDVVSVKVPVNLGSDSYASFWMSGNKTIEHRHMHFGFEFGVTIGEFLAWKLKSTHCTDEGISEKTSAHYFLSKPLIRFDGLIDSFHDSTAVKLLKKITPKIKSKYMNESDFLNPLTKQAAFYYQDINSIEPYVLKYKEKYRELSQKIISKRNSDTGDIFYGNAIRAALSNSNFKLASDLIDNSFELKDNIDYSCFKKPAYISDEYLKAINMPLISLTLNSINSRSNALEVYQVISKMLKNGADPFIKDSRGLDSIDILFLTKAINKKQNMAIFQAFTDNIEPKILKQKINQSQLSDLKKEVYLSGVKTFNSKSIKIK